MDDIVKLILSLSLSGSIIAVIIFGVKPLIKNRFSKSIQYYMWIVVLLRLIVPFSFETSIMNSIFYSNNTIDEMATLPEVQSPVNTVKNVDSFDSGNEVSVDKNITQPFLSTEQTGFLDILKNNTLYIWIFGMVIALSLNIFRYVRFKKYLNKGNRPAGDEETALLNHLLNRSRRVSLVRNKYLSTPMLVGIINPVIIIPDIELDINQLKNILLHEITHLRRFDIGIKWITFIVSSIHWFNPLMYFIKKEINSACELSCDEWVIRNLSDEEKQSYGDTLISMAAEHKYSRSILSTTMCEEKRTLRERLIAIMNHSKKSRIITVISAILIVALICTSVVLGAGVGFVNKQPPNVYISTETQKTRNAVKGGYSWRIGRQNIIADSVSPLDFDYSIQNIVSLKSNEQFVITTQKLKSDKKYDFTLEELEIYKSGGKYMLESVKPSLTNGNLYLQAPEESGEYIYSIWLNYKNRGKVNYGFVVRVDMATYYLGDIEKYRTPYIGDNMKVGNIVSLLPLPSKYFKQQYISMITSKRPYILNVYYEGITSSWYNGEWPNSSSDSTEYINMQKNALVLFCMIDNLDEVNFLFRDTPSNGRLDTSKYISSFKFSRDEIEYEFGEINKLSKNMELLNEILNGKKHASTEEIDTQME